MEEGRCSKLKSDTLNFCHTFLSNHSTNDPVNVLWKVVKKNIETLISDHVPTKLSSSKTHKPWVTTKTKRLLRKKQRYYQKVKKHFSSRLLAKYKEVKKECQRECRRAYSDFINSIVTEDQPNNKKLWAFIKSKNQENVGISDLRDESDNLIQDPVSKANILNKQFCSVFSNPLPKIFLVGKIFTKKLPDMGKISICKNGVFTLLSHIKSNKAMGPDGIPGNILKMCAYELAPVYQLLFQASIDQGTVPDDWKDASIVPLFKKGDKTKPENYRPVSLTSISGKLLEHIIHSNVMDHLDKHSFLNKYQHGFRQRRSCETQLISTLQDFSNCLNQKGQIDAILLDFSKAFDKVDHEGLLSKLDEVGISGSLHQWCRSFLLGRTQKVIVDGTSSSTCPVQSGVPQGTVLGPLFFLIYINDITEHLSPGTMIRLFADDSLLYRTINSLEDVAILQRDLDLLQSWEFTWKMEFHPQKCHLE